MKYRFLIAFLFIACQIQAQFAKADRLFDEKDFIAASLLFEEAYQKEESKYSLEKLVDCYYNTLQYDKGLKATTNLVTGKYKDADKSIKNRFYFYHSQFLFADNQWDKAIKALETYHANNGRKTSWVANELTRLKNSKHQVDKFLIRPVKFNDANADEFGVVQQGKQLYFVSDRVGGTSNKKYNWTQRPFLDVYSLPLNENNQPNGEPVSFSENINSEYHEGSFCFTKDGKTLYITRSELSSNFRIRNSIKENKVKLYQSTKKSDGEWSKPTLLAFCKENANFEHPSLNEAETQLFFASDKEGGQGNFDIYTVAVTEDGSFGAVTNLGPIINTPEREQFPFVHKDGTLFFASDGHLGHGFLDIFAAKKEGEEYQPPLNLGKTINSSFDDFSFAYATDSTGYFSSNRSKQSDDVFHFEQLSALFKNN